MRVSRPGPSLVSTLLFAIACARSGSPPGPAEVSRDAAFARYTPLSRPGEIRRRTLTPLTFALGQEAIRQRGQELPEQAVDLSKETFSLYVPPGAPPPQGWGLLVFVAPWDQPTHLKAWRAALARRRMIFVSPANAGNEKNVLDRRLPLALLAQENMRAELPI